MAVAQNQWYHFGVGSPPILVYFSGDWDVGYGILTHGHMGLAQNETAGVTQVVVFVPIATAIYSSRSAYLRAHCRENTSFTIEVLCSIPNQWLSRVWS